MILHSKSNDFCKIDDLDPERHLGSILTQLGRPEELLEPSGRLLGLLGAHLGASGGKNGIPKGAKGDFEDIVKTAVSLMVLEAFEA